MSTYKPRQGDIIEYGGYGHCRDGVAIVKYDNRQKKHHYIDTYWLSGSDSYVSPDLEKVELVFNLRNVKPVDKWVYEQYDKVDRYLLSSEHGYRKTYYVKKGAKPSLSQQIENAYEEQNEARRELDSAISSYRWATEKVTKLEEKRKLS